MLGAQHRAVVFELFGTLVASFTRHEYDPVNARMAEAVGVPYSEFWQMVAETGDDMSLGEYGTFEDYIQDICVRFGVAGDAS